ncbi:carbohydrate ABC transporter permease [Silvimonas amylolytica]|uniref:Sugar ABC transporter permease n=1 Tax=Silvimonas amylolytica TaxID=449663 RepID=A0ABQ2PNH5_9NEIS|nr:sugar ABC transporter permease [Silvimonas amylolytica]GGP26873.1 sugar ABC transporter permease [Silvimonas amylolytica]
MSSLTSSLADAPVQDTTRVRTRSYSNRHWGNALFVLPFVCVYIALLVIPVADGFWMSLHDLDVLSGDSTWVGLQNFVRLWHDGIFRGAVWNTFVFVLMTTPAFVALGLALALALNRQDRTGTALRTIFFGSSVLSVTIVTLVWRLVFMTDIGLLANVMHFFGLSAINPLTSSALALPAIALVTVWWIIGLPMMLFLAALQQIPEEIYEAAAMDNASRWRTFWAITLPSIRRTVALVATIEVILQFQLFGQAQLMTNGGPNNASRPIVQFIYEAGFQQWALGYSAAAAQVLFGLMLIGVSIQMWLSRRHDAQ